MVECIFLFYLFFDNVYFFVFVFGVIFINFIIDVCLIINVMVNVVMGVGMENMENYKLGKKVYFGIDNIYVMWNSFKMVVEVIREVNLKLLVFFNWVFLCKSNWLWYILMIFDGVFIIVCNIYFNVLYVFIYCFDGWDWIG